MEPSRVKVRSPLVSHKQILVTEGSHNSERNYEFYVPAKDFLLSLVSSPKKKQLFGGMPDLDLPQEDLHESVDLFNPNLSFSSRITPLSEAIRESQQNHMTFDFGNTKSPFRMVPPTFQKSSHPSSPRSSVTNKITIASRVSLLGHPQTPTATFHDGYPAGKSVPESYLTKPGESDFTPSLAKLIPESVSRAKANQRSLASRREDEYAVTEDQPMTSFKEFEKEITQEARIKSPFT